MSDLTFAVSEDTVVDVFGFMRDQFDLSESDSKDFGNFTAGYDVAAELRRGSVDLRSPDEVRVEELDIHWRRMIASFGVDIPRKCVGGFCLIPNLVGGCAVRAPEICVFEDDPDFEFDLDLSGLLTSEVTFTAELLVDYLSDRPSGVSYLRAQELHENNPPKVNRWGVFVDPEEVDVDIVDVADTVGDLLDSALETAIDTIFSGFDPWVRDAIRSIFGPLIDFVRDLLDVPDDIGEWLSDKLGRSLGLFNVIAEAIGDFLMAEPLLEVEDPYPILEEDPTGPLIPVKIPIEEFDIDVSDTELIVSGSIGGTS